MPPELGILADDLTGATDSGLQFAKCGRRTSVCLSWAANPPCDVLVFDTDSRNRSPTEARKRAVVATQALRGFGARRFYKKIDSTGRGNLGAEIDGMLDTLGVELALVCPAFPPLARTVRDGQIFVRGVPLDQSEFVRDPKWPATTASLEAILHRQSRLSVGFVPLAEVRSGPRAIQERLRRSFEAGDRVIVADAEVPMDLRNLSETVRQAQGAILPVGSAGLAEWLVAWFERPVRPPSPLTLGAGPILVVAGTASLTGNVQIARLVEEGARFVWLSPERTLREMPDAVRETATELTGQLRESTCVAVGLADPRQGLAELRSAIEAPGADPATIGGRLVQALGDVVGRALETVAPAALILTGGDTARAVCLSLGATSLEVRSEAAPGIPISLLQGGRWDGLPVVTKAGGFGRPDSLAQVVDVLEGLRQ
ncbi:MAG TPA: four-carbon acid sugar kinase family protein [Chloroflexota bacterium]|nr:four-carbon acid sugar kinase family protein [Chloroflexota bacterium]